MSVWLHEWTIKRWEGGSLAGHTLSQERVWYVTVQLIVLADSGCSVYTRSHSTQTTYTFGRKHPTKVVGSGTNRKVPDPLSGEGVVCKTRARGGGGVGVARGNVRETIREGAAS